MDAAGSTQPRPPATFDWAAIPHGTNAVFVGVALAADISELHAEPWVTIIQCEPPMAGVPRSRDLALFADAGRIGITVLGARRVFPLWLETQRGARGYNIEICLRPAPPGAPALGCAEVWVDGAATGHRMHVPGLTLDRLRALPTNVLVHRLAASAHLQVSKDTSAPQFKPHAGQAGSYTPGFLEARPAVRYND